MSVAALFHVSPIVLNLQNNVLHVIKETVRLWSLWYNGCNGRKAGMRVSPFSELIHQRAGSRLLPPENLVSTVPRFGRSDSDLE